MANQDPLSRSRFFHHASAFGLAGQIDRPVQQTIPTQAAVSLAPSGGHGTHRVDNYNLPGMLSFSASYVETGGSLDDVHGVYATYASSVIENLNIFNVVTADRVVSRLSIYHPVRDPATIGSPDNAEPSFSIAGSHFDNLKVAGLKIDISLDDQTFHENTYSEFCAGSKQKPNPNNKWLIGSNLKPTDVVRTQLGHNYDIVNGIAQYFKRWDPTKKQPQPSGHSFWCSAANHLDLSKVQGVPAGLKNFGGVISVPRFGVIYLAELFIHQRHRHFTMLRVTMYSPASGAVDTGGTSGSSHPVPPG